jgi:hypothetical protein
VDIISRKWARVLIVGLVEMEVIGGNEEFTGGTVIDDAGSSVPWTPWAFNWFNVASLVSFSPKNLPHVDHSQHLACAAPVARSSTETPARISFFIILPILETTTSGTIRDSPSA